VSPRRATSRERVVVRRSARGLRLEIDGTFASWWRPGRAATGSVWDALVAPLLLLPPARRRRVLILGLGGASAARLVRALAPGAAVVGVELDPAVVEAARRHFDLDALGVEVRLVDARAALARERRRFDLVIEDCFVGRGRAERKPDWLPEPGLALAARRLAPGGILVSNALDEAPAVARALGRLLPHALELRVAGYDNRVFAASARPLDARRLRAAVAAAPPLAPTLPRLRVRRLRAAAPAGRVPDPRAPGGAPCRSVRARSPASRACATSSGTASPRGTAAAATATSS
jgi:SAM-dependent methyltransferase